MKNTNYENFKLLCTFLATKGNLNSVGASFSEDEISSVDWEKVFQLADKYLVLPALYLGLKQKGYLKFLDSEARDFLHIIYELNCDHNQKLKEEALIAIRILNSEGIQPILLKGIAGLLTGLYEDDGRRIIGDIDLLVDQSEWAKAVKLFIGHGYRCGSVEDCEQVYQGAFFMKELAIMTESYSAAIDLHVRPANSSGKRAFLLAEEAREEAEVIEVEGARALLPSPHFRLMHNFYHAQHLDHCYLYGQINLRQLIDWAELWKQYGNETGLVMFNSKARLHRKSHSYRLYLLSAWKFLNIPIPKGIKISWMERLLFWRQKLCVQSARFNRSNGVFVYLAKGPLLFTPETLHQSFGDRPLRSLIKMRIIRLLELDWYLLRTKEIKRL